MTDRVFLDANILVSAAWRVDAGLLALWELADTVLLTSAYAIVEADRNVRQAEQRTRLYRLVQQLEIVDEPQGRHLPASTVLERRPDTACRHRGEGQFPGDRRQGPLRQVLRSTHPGRDSHPAA